MTQNLKLNLDALMSYSEQPMVNNLNKNGQKIIIHKNARCYAFLHYSPGSVLVDFRMGLQINVPITRTPQV